jgi:hypothetical protein
MINSNGSGEMNVYSLHPRSDDLVGVIPHFLNEVDMRPAAEQFNQSYAHGGGWRPMMGWTTRKGEWRELRLAADFYPTPPLFIQYPGDPKFAPVALIQFRDEMVWVYAHAWVAIEQWDGRVEISRMD